MRWQIKRQNSKDWRVNMEVTFEVPGQPRGKERPRWTMVSSTAIVYTPRNTRGYEDMIRTYYQVKNLHKFEKGEALEVSAIAYYKIPTSAKKGHKVLMLKGEMLPTKKPDIDNIIKIVLDALNGVAYYDDSQVCRVNFMKMYSENPRLKILIRNIGENFDENDKDI